MRVIDCEQGTPEWFAARCGIPTASMFSKIITSQGKPVTASTTDTYMNTLLAEWLVAGQVESFQSDWMARGTELEPRARAFYELETGIEVEQVGFVKHDSLDVGGSPDGLSGDRGIEIKCPAPQTHVKYLLQQKCPADYVPQVQGSMWLCEKDRWDFLSYHPDMSPLLITVERDDAFIATLEELIVKFLEKLNSKREKLRGLGVAA